MDRKEKLQEFFNSPGYVPLKLRELKVVLDVPEEDNEEFVKIINALEEEGKITISKRGRIVPEVQNKNLCAGILSCNISGKFGFLIREDAEDVYINLRDMGGAIHGDKVRVKITGSYNGKPEGSVVKVLERSKNTIVGVVVTKRGKLLRIRPDDKRYFYDLGIFEADSMGAKPGDRVAVDNIRTSADGKLWGKVSAILGGADDLTSLIESILIENKIKTEFDIETIKQAEGISSQVSYTGDDREDLREETIFTIDGELARDFDDAVSIKKTNEGYVLGVHIADVSEYVTENSPLDREAFERGTSVYLPDRVIPMLPEKLSNGVCSLNPDVDRLTLSVIMDIDLKGNVTGNKIVKSIIRSKERLTYTDINKLLSEGDKELEKRYSHILEDLKEMETLAAVLRKKRFDRGAVDFDFPESEIITDEDGIPVEVRPVDRGVSNRMIEEFMLVANETVAEFAFWAEIPFVYRCHEAPTEEKLSAFISFLKPFGLSIKGKIDENNPVKPKAFEQIIDKVRGTSVERIISKTMLRSLMKADYKPENLGHFGLAAKYYCHFTSPIRRYPDLVVHRNLKRFIEAGCTPAGNTASAAKNSSEREIAAELTERSCDDLMKAAFISNFIGMDFEGTVSGVTGFGMFVELDFGIEGLVRLENMTEDYFVCAEETQTLTGERTGKKYAVGDRVSVLVAKSDIVSRKIDFVLSQDVNRSLLRKFEDKPHKDKRRKK